MRLCETCGNEMEIVDYINSSLIYYCFECNIESLSGCNIKAIKREKSNHKKKTGMVESGRSVKLHYKLATERSKKLKYK